MKDEDRKARWRVGVAVAFQKLREADEAVEALVTLLPRYDDTASALGRAAASIHGPAALVREADRAFWHGYRRKKPRR